MNCLLLIESHRNYISDIERQRKEPSLTSDLWLHGYVTRYETITQNNSPVTSI